MQETPVKNDVIPYTPKPLIQVLFKLNIDIRAYLTVTLKCALSLLGSM